MEAREDARVKSELSGIFSGLDPDALERIKSDARKLARLQDSKGQRMSFTIHFFLARIVMRLCQSLEVLETLEEF
jgi:hypothetical protein